MQKFTFEVTVEEANQILEGLGHLPYNKVYQVIIEIQRQAQEQLQPKEE